MNRSALISYRVKRKAKNETRKSDKGKKQRSGKGIKKKIIISAIMLPEIMNIGARIFPSYAGGKYPMEQGTMIVSRGLARESTLAPRIFNRPELVIIDLQ